MRYDPTRTVGLRGSVSTGFRAPGVQQKFYSSVSTNLNAAGVLTETLTAREGSAVTRAFGIAPLKEETSKSASIGMVLRPPPNFSVTADLYRTDIDDRIVFSSNIAPESRPLPDRRRVPDQGHPRPAEGGPGAVLHQCDRHRTNGFDLVAEHTSKWPGRHLVLSGQLGFNQTEVTTRHSQSPVLTGAQLFDDAQVTLIERGQPRQHHVIAADYTAGAWNLNTRANYYGEVQGQGFTAPSSRPGKRSGWSTCRCAMRSPAPERWRRREQRLRHLPDRVGQGPGGAVPATGLHALLGDLPDRHQRPLRLRARRLRVLT